jgi:hypothetical protein
VEYADARQTERHLFAIDIELTDVQSGTQIRARTKELSLFGCSVDTSTFFPRGTHVRIKLSYGGANVRALARVVYANPDLGMGFVLTSVEPEDERILGNWIAGLMNADSDILKPHGFN